MVPQHSLYMKRFVTKFFQKSISNEETLCDVVTAFTDETPNEIVLIRSANRNRYRRENILQLEILQLKRVRATAFNKSLNVEKDALYYSRKVQSLVFENNERD